MTISSNPLAATAAPQTSGLSGAVQAPGDKSVSHRALLLGGMAEGETRITGLLESDDVLNTAKALAALGATVTRTGPGAWVVRGVGAAGFKSPSQTLDFGNAGTGSRLAMGVVAGYPIAATFDGDSSLRGRPMERILAPLRLMGAEADTAPGGKLPLVLRGKAQLQAIRYAPPQASAQVKSAILLAAIHAKGETVIDEAHATRDHSENMLNAFGATVETQANLLRRIVSIQGGAQLRGQSIATPGDPSSAAFLVAAGLLIPGSSVRVNGVMLNPTRIGLFETLREMGADLSIENVRLEGGEKTGDLVARHSVLRGVEVPPDRAPSMIDEYPILSVIAA
ncbi:MAG: 3-phosphoshikimate 1-carboxyvinyltransferase, partial [Caulobacterales bacterium]